MKDWFYNEQKHAGVDYSHKDNAYIYDAQMESFRDYEKEANEFVDKLGAETPEELLLIDIGCGTGAFGVHAAKYFNKVLAVDVSKEMLSIAKSKAEALNLDNIEFHNSGFLNFKSKEEADIVFTKWAFHHLPDFWKQAALININTMLKIDGLFLLTDVIFKYAPDFEQNIEQLLQDLSQKNSHDFVEETKVHIREEYSTFDWIMHGLIERAGFEIEAIHAVDPLASEYYCRKKRHL